MLGSGEMLWDTRMKTINTNLMIDLNISTGELQLGYFVPRLACLPSLSAAQPPLTVSPFESASCSHPNVLARLAGG